VETVFFPLDDRLNLTAYRQTTRRLERLVCDIGVRLPYEQTADLIWETLGVTISGRQVEHIIDRQGKRAIEQRDREVEEVWKAPVPMGRQPDGPDVLYIEADGAWINSRSGLHTEGKVGVVHQGSDPVGHNRKQLRSAIFCVTFQGSERLGEELYLEADRQGLERAGQVIVLGDGASWIRELHRTHFYDALYVLDWFHLHRNLCRALKRAGPELGKDYIAAKRMTLSDFLWCGEVDLMLDRLDRLRFQLRNREAREALASFKRYLLNNREGLVCYADFDEQGLHVGSGPVEKAADLIINRRCELRGMTWYPDTADGICNLRALRLNKPVRWQQFWQAA
jgi:hypothetical protein